MTVRIERTDGLVLMSPEELHAEAARQDGEIVIRLSAEALKKPGAFFRIHCAPDTPPGIETPATTDNLQGEPAV